MYRIIDDVLSEDNLINIEQNVLEAPIFASYQSTAFQHSDNIYDVMMSRVFYSSYYPLCEYDKEYLPYFHPLLDKVVDGGFLLRVSLNLTFAKPIRM